MRLYLLIFPALVLVRIDDSSGLLSQRMVTSVTSESADEIDILQLQYHGAAFIHGRECLPALN